MAFVKQVRVLRNVVLTGLGCGAILWLVGDHIGQSLDALLLGALAGVVSGVWRWRRLLRKVTRHDRRFEPNKILVNYLNLGEVLISAVAYNHYLAIPLILVGLLAGLLGYVSAHWWTVLGGSFGLSGALVVAGGLVWTERTLGPIYYQYNSRHWQGAEGMVFRSGQVVRRLAPQGLVRIDGELWSAVAMDGTPVEVGERVEVLRLDGLVLCVDRLPPQEAPTDRV